jgi:Nucleotidyltransferase of unknown function (DUF6036)
MGTQAIFTTLNDELRSRKLTRELVICGGAALIALKVVRRGTKDVDVLKPKIDHDLQVAALAVAQKHGLSQTWLNNGPAMLVKELPEDCETHCSVIYDGTHLKVSAIGRRDLIYSKLYAATERTDDITDLVALKPTVEELSAARDLVLQQDASEIWPQIVDECIAEVRRLSYGK